MARLVSGQGFASFSSYLEGFGANPPWPTYDAELAEFFAMFDPEVAALTLSASLIQIEQAPWTVTIQGDFSFNSSSTLDSLLTDIESGIAGEVTGLRIDMADTGGTTTLVDISMTPDTIALVSGDCNWTFNGSFPTDFPSLAGILGGTASIPADADFAIDSVYFENTPTGTTASLVKTDTGLVATIGDATGNAYELVFTGEVYTSLSDMLSAAGVSWSQFMLGDYGALTVSADSVVLRDVATQTPLWTLELSGGTVAVGELMAGLVDPDLAFGTDELILDVSNDTAGVELDLGFWDDYHGGGRDPELIIEGTVWEMPWIDGFVGGSGDDLIQASYTGEGTYIDGGAGTDTVFFDDFLLSATITDNGDGSYGVAHHWGWHYDDGYQPEVLVNIEQVQFRDGTYNLADLANAGSYDDGFEDNDSMAQAANLDPFFQTESWQYDGTTETWTMIEGTFALLDDADWFTFTVPEEGYGWGSAGVWNASFDDPDDVLVLTLYDSDGNQLSSSSDGYLEVAGLAGGQYYFQVTGTMADPRYELYSHAEIGGDYVFDDYYEDNDAPGEEWYLGLVEGPFHYDELIVHDIDEDWFGFSTEYTGSADDFISVTANGSVTLELYRYNAEWTDVVFLGSNDTSDGPADVSLEGLDPGYYMVRVTSPSSDNVSYSISGIAPGYTEDDNVFVGADGFEDNDTRATATNVETAFTSYEAGLYDAWSLSVESGDEDWYAFTLDSTAGPGASVELFFLHSYGDIDMALYREDETSAIGSATTIGDHEYISLAGLEAGTYYVNVYGYGGDSNPWYDMRVNTGGSGDDWWEDNDSAWEAPYMGVFEGDVVESGLIIRSGDDDWYSFDLYGAGDQAQDGTYGVQVALDDPSGNVILELYSGVDATTPVRTAQSVNGVAAIDFGGLADGFYYIRGTTPDADARYGYTVSGTGPESSLPTYDHGTPDAAEDNDSFEEAADLGALSGAATVDDTTFGGAGNLSLDPTDPDWYRFEIGGDGASGNAISIDIANAGALDYYEVELGVYDTNGNWVTGGYAYKWTGSGTDYSESWAASLEMLQAGRYYLGVESWQASDIIEYTLDVQAPTEAVIQPDAYEDNDSFAQAYDLGELVDTTRALSSLTMRPSDEDWYRFTTAGVGDASNAVVMTSDDGASNLNLELYDASGAMIAGGWSNDSNETVDLRHLPAGEYYVRVYEATGGSNSGYNLSIVAPPESTVTLDPDRFEDNDTRATATDLGTIEGVRSEASLTAEAGDADWYRFTTTTEGGVDNRVSINFAHADGDVDMELYDADGNWLSGSYSATDNESISLEGRPAGTYYVHVYGWGGADNAYSLRVNAPVAPEIADVAEDAFEGMGTLTLGTLGGSTTAFGSAHGNGELTIHDGDEDFFSFTIADNEIAASNAAVTLTFAQANGDLDLEVYSLDTGAYIGGSHSITDNESFSLAGLGAGQYAVRVFGWEPNGDYSIALTGGVDTSVAADRYEDNDTAAEAHAFGRLTGTNTYDNLTVESGDSDWYSFRMAARGGENDHVRLSFQHARGDVDVELYRADASGGQGDYIAGSYSVGNSEHISLQGLDAGTYFVHVYGHAGASNPNYSMAIQAPAAVTLVDDALEDNDTLDTATPLNLTDGVSTRNDLVITQGDPDWFTFALTGNEIAGSSARIDFSHAAGDLDLELYDAAGNRLTGSYSTSNQERIALSGYEAGQYYLRVAGYNDARNPSYDLNVNVVTGVASDRFENNDSRATATSLGTLSGTNTWSNLTAQSNDDDWYRFELQNTGRVNDQLEVLFSHAQGDVDVSLYDANGNWISGGYSVSDNETISLNGLEAGRYFVRVYGYNGQENADYALRITAPAPLVDDGYEDNDTLETASDLGTITGQRSFNGLAALDEDWYEFQLAETGGASDGVRVSFSHALGDVDAALYDAAGNWVAGSYSISDDEYISFDGLEAGTYHLKVWGWGGAQNPEYDLAFRAEGVDVRPDRFEDNDTTATATRLRDLTGRNEWTGMSIDGDDGGLSSEGANGGGDWYRFTLSADGRSGNYIQTLFSHRQGDVDMQLFSVGDEGSLSLVGGSYGVGDSERISLNGQEAGQYYLRVYGYNDAVNPDYSLVIDAAEATANIPADALESNDTRETASRLMERSVSLTNLSIHEGDVDGDLDGDWFVFTMDRAGSSGDAVSIDFDHGLGDVDMALYADDGSRLRVSQGIGNSETISLNGLSAGDYYVRVYGYAGATNPQYSLNLEAPVGVGAAPAAVSADRFEDNDTRATATGLGALRGERSYDNLTIDSGDNTAASYDGGDWYAVDVVGNGEFSVSVAFDHSRGDVDLQLYDASGALLDGSYGIGNSEAVSVDVSGASADTPITYYVRAYGYSSATNSYSMSIDAPLGNDISADRLESNNTAASATEILDASAPPQDLTIHDAADVDWFTFTTEAEGTAGDYVAVSYQGGPISFELYGADGETLIGGNTDSDGRTGISLNGLDAGTYFLKVAGDGNSTIGNYDLDLRLPAPVVDETPAQDSLTLFVYMAADNNLEGAAIDDINEMEAVNLPDNVNVVVLVDRAEGYDTSNGDWTNARAGLITHDNNTSRISSQLESVSDLGWATAEADGELNMGRQAVLTEFLDWGVSNFAADNYGVVIWNHGGGLAGSAWDDSAGHDNLSVAEVTAALQASSQVHDNGGNYGLVGFDACLQAIAGQAFDLRTADGNGWLADVFVASEDLEPGDGWDYTALLQRVAANPNLSMQDLGAAVVETYDSFYGGRSTQSALDTSGFDAVLTALDAFVDAIDPSGDGSAGGATADDWEAMVQARTQARQFYNADYRDLGGFMQAIADNGNVTTQIQAAAQGVASALENSLIRQVDVSGANGLTIYLPSNTSAASSWYNENNFAFLGETRWDDFLSMFTDDDLGGAPTGGGGSRGDFAETMDRGGFVVRAGNDTRYQAYDLGEVFGDGTEVRDVDISAGDVDWFRFQLAGDGTASDAISIVFDGAEGDLDLGLYDNQGRLLASGTASDTGEQVSLDGLQTGREYFVRVAGAGDSDTAQYRLQVAAPEPAEGSRSEGGRDFAEGISGNDSMAKAYSLGQIQLNERLPTVTGLTIDAVDLADSGDGTANGDWYVLNPSRGSDLNPNGIVVRRVDGDGALQVRLYDADGNEYTGLQVTSGADYYSVSYPETNDPVYVHVTADGEADYTLDVARRQLDVDGNGEANASDALQMLAYAMGARGALGNFISDGAQRADADDVADYLGHAELGMLDVDGNGTVGSNDSIMTLAYVMGFRNESIFTNFLSDDATRSATQAIEFLDLHMPAADRSGASASRSSELDLDAGVRLDRADGDEQIISVTPVDLSAYAGETIEIAVTYSTEPADQQVEQLTLNLYWDSSDLELQDKTLEHTGGYTIFLEDADSTDRDNDANTDRFIGVNYMDFGGNWPGDDVTMPLTLYTATFTVAEGAATTAINFTGDAANGFSLNAPSYSINVVPSVSVTAGAGGEADGSVTFTVSLSGASAADVSVAFDLGVAGDTAGSADYDADNLTLSNGLSISGGRLVFAAGTTTGTITVPVVDDDLVEGDETLTLELSDADGVVFADGADSVSAQATLSDDDAAIMTIADAADVTEGDDGDTTDMSFTVTLDKASVNDITVDYVVGAGGDTATSGDDYTATSGTLTIAAGETTGTITVPVLGDNADEGNETLTVTLSNASGASLGNTTATGTIVDDDVVASIGDATLVEGDDGSTNMVFTVTLSRNAASTVTIAYDTSDGTATAGEDYTATSGTLTIAAGSNSGTITVPVLGDTVIEGDQTFTLTLSDAQNAHLSGGGDTLEATGNITDDDTATVSVSGPAAAVGEASDGELEFTVTMSAAAETDVTVNYSLGGTATAGDDYTAASGSVTIAAGETSATISLPVLDDAIQEGSETVTVTLDGTDNASVSVDGANATATGSIADDDTVTVSVADASVTEGDGGATTTAEFEVSLNLASTSDITMNYALANGTTEAGDFDPASITGSDGITVDTNAGTITIAAGTTSGTISVTVNGDDVDEGDSETFDLQLTGLAGAQDISFDDADGGTDMTATGTIEDDDDAVVTITGPADPVAEDAGSADFTVSLSHATESGTVIDWSTANGTAIAGFGDYVAEANGTVTYAAGESGDKTFSVTINDDAVVEGDETFSVNASVASGEGSLAEGSDSHTVTIADDDTAVIDSVTLTQQGTEDNRQMIITVTLSAALASAVTIDYATADDTAVAGEDYTAKNGTLVIAPGNTTGIIRVPVTDDALYEGGDETFTVTLSNPSIDFGDGVATNDAGAVELTNTITDNDAAPTVSVESVVVDEGDGTATFTVTLSNATSEDTTVTYGTTDGTATAGEDYEAIDGETLTIAAGETTATFTVDITDDTDAGDAATEDFTVTVDTGTSTDTATGTILDDDSLWAVVRDVTVDETSGEAVFTVRLTQAADEDITLDYATADGTATAGTDYTAATGTLTIAAGETSGTITVAVDDDTAYEGTETFALNLSNIQGGGAQLANLAASATIVDAAPTISVADVSQAEGDGNMVFTVALSESVGNDVSFNYNFADGADSFTVRDGDAADGTDYDSSGLAGTATITAGSTSVTISVPVTDDATVEADEVFTLTLDSLNDGGEPVTFASGGSTETAIGTIENDDASMAVLTHSDAGTWGIQPISDLGGGDWSADEADFIQLGNYGLDWQPVGVVPLGSGGFDILAWNSSTADFGIMYDAESYQRINVIDNYGDNWSLAGGADLDGDGFTDLLVQDTNNGRIGVLDFASAASDDFEFNAVGTSDMQAVGFVDLQNDGVMDILLTGEGGEVAIIPGSASDAFDFSADAVEIGSFGDGWVARGGTDVDNDGLLDILMEYEGTDSAPEGDFGLLEVDANGENASWDWLNDFGPNWSVDGIGLYQ